MKPEPLFITDENGAKKSVILSLEDYEGLMEDLADLAVIAERRDEPTSSLGEVMARLKQDGLLPD